MVCVGVSVCGIQPHKEMKVCTRGDKATTTHDMLAINPDVQMNIQHHNNHQRCVVREYMMTARHSEMWKNALTEKKTLPSG
jgi:hypothetical protein